MENQSYGGMAQALNFLSNDIEYELRNAYLKNVSFSGLDCQSEDVVIIEGSKCIFN